jgi:hypothetical protein
MVQAGAGSGKSYLLMAVYLWCILNKKKCEAAAPTGIAAANIEIEGTNVRASTIHALCDLDGKFRTRRDLTKMDDDVVRGLFALDVLALDEVSMIDDEFWEGLENIFGQFALESKPSRGLLADPWGDKHVLLFGDFQQLPPATNRPPFIVLPSVYKLFDFCALTENRRVACSDDPEVQRELESYHVVLQDVAQNRNSPCVAKFLVEAFGRGAQITGKDVSFEGSTAVFAKRKDRNSWNGKVVKRILKTKPHALKVQARFRATYATDRLQWYQERWARANHKKFRTQVPWLLQVAGNWIKDPRPVSAESPDDQNHLMRVMLVANVEVKERFANGAQGRLLSWHPSAVKSGRLLASHPELLFKFVKEKSWQAKKEFLPEIDYMDVPARSEALSGVKGISIFQEPFLAAYALTNHKVQSLTIKHNVYGCLEGIFAQGALYVLLSRVTDPQKLHLVGLPPRDLLDSVACEWLRRGLDVNECMRAACSVTGDWFYRPVPNGRSWDAAVNVEERLTRKIIEGRSIPVKHKKLAEVLNPQPRLSSVLRQVQAWIMRASAAWLGGKPKPHFETETGEIIFPEDDEEWWLTDVQCRKPTEEIDQQVVLEEGPWLEDEESRAGKDIEQEHEVEDDDNDSIASTKDSAEEGLDNGHDSEDDLAEYYMNMTQLSYPSVGDLPPVPPQSQAAESRILCKKACSPKEDDITSAPSSDGRKLPQASAGRHGGPKYLLPFEKQGIGEALCGLHALRNVLAGENAAAVDRRMMSEACEDLVRESLQPDANGVISDPQEHDDHEHSDGWYSAAVMGRALQRANAYTLLLGLQLKENPDAIFDPDAAGAVVNQDNKHWVALKAFEKKVWKLDSLAAEPTPMTHEDFVTFISRPACP